MAQADAADARRADAPAPPPIRLLRRAPEINAAGAAVEQSAQGNSSGDRAACRFRRTRRRLHRPEFPGAAIDAEARRGRGGIDISLAVGPDHIFEILNGNMAVFTKKGKNYDTTGKLLYGRGPE